jgi:hypothetical protein
MVHGLVEAMCQQQCALSVKLGERIIGYGELEEGKEIIMSLRFKSFTDISEEHAASIFRVEV